MTVGAGPVTRFRLNTIAPGAQGPQGPPGIPQLPIYVTGLSTFAPTTQRQSVPVDGYSAPGDGGGGTFVWNATDTRAADGGTIIAVTGIATGRWNRVGVTPTQFNVKHFGAAGDGVTDDAPVFRHVQALITALNGGSAYIPPGTYLFQTMGPNGAFVTPTSGTTWHGDGDTSVILIANGINQAGGWSAAFGQNPFNPGSPVSNVQFLRFSCHCNSANNQWSGAGGATYHSNTVVSVPFGNNITIDHVSVFDHNGSFAVLVGLYGDPQSVTNYAITNCTLNHMGDDPNVADGVSEPGDVSWISCSGTNGLVTGNRIDFEGSATNTAWHSAGGAPCAALECHGFNTVIAHNTINGTATAINTAADSFDGGGLDFNHNVITNATAGFACNAINGHVMRGLKICDNIIRLRATGDPSGPENGISWSSYSTLSVAIGLGLFDVQITGNLILGATTPTTNSCGMLLQQHQTGGNSVTLATWAATTTYSPFHLPNCIVPTVLNGYYYCILSGGTSGTVQPIWPTTPGLTVTKDGVTYLCVGPTASATIQTGGGYQISGNKIRSFHGYGIVASVPDNAGPHNLCQDVHVNGNHLLNVGPTGIAFGGGPDDVAPDFPYLQCMGNVIVDDRGGSSILVDPVYVNAWTDANSIVTKNVGVGYSGTLEHFASSFVTLGATSFWPSETFRQITATAASVGATVFPGALLTNPTPATSGATEQDSPALYQQGAYWSGSASVECAAIQKLIASSTPAIAWSTQTAGGAYTTILQATYISSSKATLSTALTNFVIDLSGGSSRSIVLALDNAGAAAISFGGTNEWAFTKTTFGAFGHSAQPQPTVTGSRGSNAALASLLTGLASLGLVVDSSS